ncbi:MAG: GntR family transcriptional regulator [Oscillospiraceae bacterium]
MILQLDFSGDVPIYLQIRNQIVVGIASGKLQPGERLLPIRALADEAGVNMMTVNKAYALLKKEGYIVADRRSGAAVAGISQRGGLTEKTREDLKLAISEAKTAPVSKEDLLSICARYYDETEGNI